MFIRFLKRSQGNYHLSIIESVNSDKKREILGIISLEDIVEEILQAEIIDEYDLITDNKSKRRRKFSGRVKIGFMR